MVKPIKHFLFSLTKDELSHSFVLVAGLQQLSLDQGAGQGWGSLPRGSLPHHFLPPPPGNHSHAHQPSGGTSAFNPFHHAIEQRSPRMQGPASGKVTFN